MELILTRPDTTAPQVIVTCDGQSSHMFDLSTLIPTKTNGLPHPLADPFTYGTALYEALFPLNSLANQLLTAKPKRIVLVAFDDDLDAIPWEYAYGSGYFLACACSVVRGLPAEQRIAPPDILSGLHIVAVPSSPLSHDLAPLNIQGEWTRLVEIVEDPQLQRAVALERAWPPTIERLRDLVAGEPQRVVHFMGHGGQDDDGEAVLCFERENGVREDITAREFVQRVQGSAFLVTLNACQSAMPGETVFGNLTHALVSEQVPYALGMRFSIHDDDALAFSRTFYRNLARGLAIEESLRQARLTLVKSERAWVAGNLVLYTSLTQAAPGYKTAPGEPDISDTQETTLRGIIGVLPEVQGAFQGRINEQIHLGTWLTGDHRPRIITIHGSGGQGKTALARVAAERFAHAWPGGVWAITLESLPTRAIFVASLARFLAINTEDSARPAELERLVLLRLRRQRTLLVLDNLETLDEAAKAQNADALSLVAFIQQLAGERTSLLCTSRHLLGWSGERHLELPGLSSTEGAALFQQSAPNRTGEIDLSLALQVSRRVDGHPLGLFLLGKAFNAISLPLETFLTDYETFLLSAENRFADVEHRQRTLYANIAYSVKWLPPELLSLYSKLWLFHTPFSLVIAIFILDPDAETHDEGHSPVADQLHTLWQRGLLTREGSVGQMLLLRVPPVIRPYIERYLADESERGPLLARFGIAYAGLVQFLYQDLHRGAGPSTLAMLCYDDLERGSAHMTGIHQGYYLLEWGWVLQQLGDRLRGLTLTEQALEIGQNLDQNLLMRAMSNMAHMYRDIGKPQEALRLYEQALPIMKEVGYRTLEVATLDTMAGIYKRIGKPQEALRLYEQALLIAREVGDRAGEATTLSTMALLYHDIGKPLEALRLLERALPIMKEVGYHASDVATLDTMAGVYHAIGKPQEALRLYEQALLIAREVGDHAGEATTLSNMALLYHDIGRPQDALHLYEQALLMRREVGDRAGEATTLYNSALLYHSIGRPQDALHLLEKALSMRHEMGDRTWEATTLSTMASVYHDIGKPQEALRLYEQALPIAREVGDRAWEVITLSGLASLYEAFARYAEAQEAFEHSIVLSHTINHPAAEIADLIGLALLLYRHLNQPQDALAALEKALTIFRETGLPQDAERRKPGQIAALLHAMRNGTFPRGQESHTATMPTKRIATIVDNTIAVMTRRPKHRAEWREAMIQAMQDAQQRGADWQIEVEFFTAILAILDGQSPTLPADHPYSSAIAAIQDGIAKGSLTPNDDEDEDAEHKEVQALEVFVQTSAAALRSTDPQEKMAYMQQLVALQGQAPDYDMKALLQTIQFALFGGDLAHLGDHLTGLARQIWDMIVAGVQQDDTLPETPDGA